MKSSTVNANRPLPVFVVGVPRSGTTLLAAMLGTHSRMGCGPETSFFNELTRVRTHRLLNRRSWPEAAIDFLFSMRLGGEPVPDRYHLTRNEVFTYLKKRRPSVSAMLEALTEQYVDRLGKVRWVEKSPSHLLRGHVIRNHYPDAPIIRIVRDPRDVALSLEKVPWGVGSFVEGLLYWREFDEDGNAFIEHDSKTLTVRYEDLLNEPVTVLTSICAFLGEQYEESMLDTSEASAHVQRGNEVWKNRVGQAVDPSRASAWRSCLGQSEIRLADAIVGDRLQDYGYPVETVEIQDMKFLRVYPLRRESAHYDGILRQFVESGFRLWPDSAFEEATLDVYLGNPGHSSWLGYRAIERTSRMFQLTAEIVTSRLRNHHVAWLHRPDQQEAIGRCGFLIKRFLDSTPADESWLLDLVICKEDDGYDQSDSNE